LYYVQLHCKIPFLCRSANFSDIFHRLELFLQSLRLYFRSWPWAEQSIFTQHVDDENVVVISVKSHVRMYINQIRLPQVIVSTNCNASLWKIPSRRSVQFFHQPTHLGTLFFRHHGVWHENTVEQFYKNNIIIKE